MNVKASDDVPEEVRAKGINAILHWRLDKKNRQQ
jgi:hypothetical protein